MAGIRTPAKISQMRDELPEVYGQFEEIAEKLERHYRDVQDLEFTIERGKLYMLQTRSAKRTAPAAVRVAVEMVNEGILSREEALKRVEPAQIVQLLLPRFDEAAKAKAKDRFLAKGLNASPGAATGKAVFDPDRAVEAKAAGDPVILVRIETSPDDVHGMLAARGVLTARGGATSHAAVVARSMGLPCVAGAESLRIDYAKRQMRAGGRDRRRGRHDQHRRHDRGDLRRRAADHRGPLRGRARARHASRLGRRRAPSPGLGERRLPARRRARAGVRGAGHRSVPNRAHVLRGGSPADGAAHDPGCHARHRGKAPTGCRCRAVAGGAGDRRDLRLRPRRARTASDR